MSSSTHDGSDPSKWPTGCALREFADKAFRAAMGRKIIDGMYTEIRCSEPKIELASVEQYLAAYELRLDLEDALIQYRLRQYPWYFVELDRLRRENPGNNDHSIDAGLRRRAAASCPPKSLLEHRNWIKACREGLGLLRHKPQPTPPPVASGTPAVTPEQGLQSLPLTPPSFLTDPTLDLSHLDRPAAGTAPSPRPATPPPSPTGAATPATPNPFASVPPCDTAASLRAVVNVALGELNPARPTSVQTGSAPAAPGRPA